MKYIYVVMHGWSCDIMSEVYPIAYFSSEEKAEDYILQKNLLNVQDYETYVQKIELDKF